ncbi:hypothetical protein X546_25295 [Brevibacillus borstelensis cifa_chp40]|nr:hypothetical protein X546_25295 [Brevibacillus borstelensis cifa_chp40]
MKFKPGDEVVIVDDPLNLGHMRGKEVKTLITFVKQVDGNEQTFEAQTLLGVINTNVKSTEQTNTCETPANRGAES